MLTPRPRFNNLTHHLYHLLVRLEDQMDIIALSQITMSHMLNAKINSVNEAMWHLSKLGLIHITKSLDPLHNGNLFESNVIELDINHKKLYQDILQQEIDIGLSSSHKSTLKGQPGFIPIPKDIASFETINLDSL